MMVEVVDRSKKEIPNNCFVRNQANISQHQAKLLKILNVRGYPSDPFYARDPKLPGKQSSYEGPVATWNPQLATVA